MNEQIEEMANDLAKICPDLVENCCGQVNCVTHLTLSLTKLGYRKSTDVAREIFAEIEDALDNLDTYGYTEEGCDACVTFEDVQRLLERLKKKYESEGEE